MNTSSLITGHPPLEQIVSFWLKSDMHRSLSCEHNLVIVLVAFVPHDLLQLVSFVSCQTGKNVVNAYRYLSYFLKLSITFRALNCIHQCTYLGIVLYYIVLLPLLVLLPHIRPWLNLGRSKSFLRMQARDCCIFVFVFAFHHHKLLNKQYNRPSYSNHHELKKMLLRYACRNVWCVQNIRCIKFDS